MTAKAQQTGMFMQPSADERNMYTLQGDEPMCEPYHGAFRGTTILIVGYGTEHEEIFTRGNRHAAIAKATKHQTTIAHLGVTQFCHESIVNLLGA